MSRICVKNLPKHANEGRLRDFFSQKGEITDAKLMRTKDGKSRQFAFIGFRMEQEAEEALKFFNNSYMDTNRLTCEVAHKVNDPNIPRPWSRYSAKKANLNDSEKNLVGENSHSLQKDHKPAKNEAKTSKNCGHNDPQLQEFLQVMQPRAKSKLWADDTVNTADRDDKVNMEAHLSASKKKQSNKENKFANKASSSPALKGCSETNPIKQSNENVHDDDISDMDYFKNRIKKNWSDSETDHVGSHGEGIGSIKSKIAELESRDHTVETRAQIHGGINHDETKVKPSFKGSDVEDDENVNQTTLTSDDKKDIDISRLFIRNLPFTVK